MKKTILSITVILVSFFLFGHSAAADSITLKNGQVYEGKITAEEEGRIQVKLKGSGARLWFSRDQVREYKKSNPDKSEEKDADGTNPEDTSASPEDDVARAQALLDKIRAERPEISKSNGGTKKSAKAEEPEKKDSGPKVELPTYTDEEIDALIKQLRTAPSIYDRRNACIELGNAEAVQAIPDLIHVLEDETPMMRKEANNALKKITGEDFGFNPVAKGNVRLWAIERWQKWYKEIKDEEAKKTLKSYF